jgi:hypothetical protein
VGKVWLKFSTSPLSLRTAKNSMSSTPRRSAMRGKKPDEKWPEIAWRKGDVANILYISKR